MDAVRRDVWPERHMKVAYLILTHKNPNLLKRAIGALSSERCAFFIHIDLKTDIREFSGIGGKNVFLSEQRMSVSPGSSIISRPGSTSRIGVAVPSVMPT